MLRYSLICVLVLEASALAENPTGTAFVVAPDGYLVTCEHVVRGAKEIRVTIAGEDYAATVLGADKQGDLALLKVDPAEPLVSRHHCCCGSSWPI